MRIIDEKWFLIVCNLDFKITDIIITKNIAISLEVKNQIIKILSPDNVPKFLDFAVNLRNEKAVFGYKMSIIDDTHSSTIMDFSGIGYGDNYIITAFSNYISFNEELMNINNEQINFFRGKLKDSYTAPVNYEKFTQLNNEIINMERELHKQNAYILDLLTKKEEMLSLINTQKNFFKQMLDAIPDLIFYKGIDRKYLGCNKAFAENLIGLTEEEIIGKTELDFIDDEQKDRFFIHKDNEILASGESTKYEVPMKMANGTVSVEEVLKTPFYDENGKIAGLIGISRDISLRKSMEKKLVKAKEAAESANVMKSQFLANMSHEIRNPMNGVLGFLDLLKMTTLSSEQEEYICEAKSASEMLLYLINDILDLSKIEAGKLSFENINFNIRTVVEDAISIIVPKAFKKQIELHTMIKASVPEKVIGDPGRIRQILNNLVGNAVKFTEKGEINVTVDCIEGINGKVLLSFEIKDTGIGISEHSIDQIFRPFMQADASTTRKFGGTGLGLAISKELVS